MTTHNATIEPKASGTRRWRWGVNRWLILLFAILGFIASRRYPPIMPHIQLPAERLSETPLFTLPIIGPFYLTNTIVATFLADLVLLLVGFLVYRMLRGGKLLVLKGVPGAIEAILEAIMNLTQSTAGKWAKNIFPYFATISLLVLAVNWMELIPGVDSIGILHESDHGYPVEQVVPGVYTIVPGEEAEGEAHGGYMLVPYVRVASTDLNFTVALALVAIAMTQVIGARALGGAYFLKFFNVSGIFSRPLFGVIDFAVSLLELISEFSKILSFSFRLFGNIFAGSVLLFVIGYLVPVFAQSIFLGLEFFVGVIQALVFGMLTMIFMTQATQGHGGHEEPH